MNTLASSTIDTSTALIDSHTHLDMVIDRGTDFQQITSEAQELGVKGAVQIAGDKKSIEWSKQFVEDYSHLWPMWFTVGAHPGEAHEADTAYGLSFLDEYHDHNKLVAIGEIGLDYYYGKDTRSEQQKVFDAYLEKAVELNLPVCIHTRDAHQDTLDRVKEAVNHVKVLIHCFTGDKSQAADYLEIGCYLSFSGIVTFKNAVELREAFDVVPHEKLLVETDAPYLAPVPKRGKSNRPAWVRHTASFLAKRAAINEPDFFRQLTDNTLNFYSIET